MALRAKKRRLSRFLVLLIAIVLSAYSCSSPQENNSKENNSQEYIYVSHTRLNTNDSVYSKIYDIDFSTYDMTLLGGDLALSSFNNDTITEHLNTIFDFKKPTTLWSAGNHDNTSAKKFKRITNKNKYHSHIQDDITFITLNSQDSLSSIVSAQKDFLYQTLDSLSTSVVVLMTHKLIFMNDHPVMDSQIAQVCNANKGSCFHCHNPNNFYQDVYPELLKLKEKGVQVIWVGGDLGYKTSEFEYVDDNGITFLGNGIWYPKDWNKVLIFSKEEDSLLAYRFVHIDTLLKNQKSD